MKLNYSALQHAVLPVEGARRSRLPLRPAGRACFALHGQLAPLAWAYGAGAAGRARSATSRPPAARCPAATRDVVRELRGRGLLAGHLTAGAGVRGRGRGDHDRRRARTTACATLGWDAAVCGPGPGHPRLGARRSGTAGMAALDSAHTALALGCATLVVCPRMSSGDPRERHRGLSHHTRTVLELLLAPVTVAAPAGGRGRGRAPERRAPRGREARGRPRRATPRAGCRRARWAATLDEDQLFFAAALAAGRALAGMIEDGMSGAGASSSAIGGETVWEGRIVARATSSASATPTARRSSARSSRHPGAVGDRRPRRRARLARAPAARDGRRAGRCSRSRPASSTSPGEPPLETRAARARRGDRQGRRSTGSRSATT